jgi:hypothetical protein
MKKTFPLILSFLILTNCKKEADLKKLPAEITLHDYMEDYVEVVEEDFKKNPEANRQKLLLLLKAIPFMAIDENKEEWQKIVDKHLSENEPLESCKACHQKFKKSYKNTYRKRLIPIDRTLFETSPN